MAVFAWAFLPPELVWRMEPDRILPRGGNAFTWVVTTPAFLPDALIPSDDLSDHARSRLLLLEQGRPLGPPHSLHDDISNAGSGRYSHWAGAIIFAASDNTDPRTNGRVYQARASVAPPPVLVAIAGIVAAALLGIGLVLTWRRVTPGMIERGRRILVRLVAGAGAVVAAGILGWALFPPQAVWQIEADQVLPREGHAFAWVMPAPTLSPFATVRGDDADGGNRSGLRLSEDGKPLGPPHSVHRLISDIGAGLYSHWGDDLIVFSSSDNTDPRSNGRAYHARARIVPAGWLTVIGAGLLAGALGLSWRHLLRTRRRATAERWAHVAAGAPAAIFLAAAVAATISILGVFQQRTHRLGRRIESRRPVSGSRAS